MQLTGVANDQRGFTEIPKTLKEGAELSREMKSSITNESTCWKKETWKNLSKGMPNSLYDFSLSLHWWLTHPWPNRVM
jgi:hypothetical protein